MIIEDEPLAVEKLENTLSALGMDIEVVSKTESIESSVMWLRANPSPDVMLVDIELADGQSFAIFEQVEIQSAVIFTTSYHEYAIRAFKLNSVDYLLKPVDPGEVKNALNKYQRVWASKRVAGHSGDMKNLIIDLKKSISMTGYRSRFLVKKGQQLVSIEVDDIAFFFAEGRLCFFTTWNKGKFVVDYTLEEIEDMLDPDQYFRASRSHIIHVRAVSQLHSYFNGKLKVLLKPEVLNGEVIVSRERSGAFKTWLGR